MEKVRPNDVLVERMIDAYTALGAYACASRSKPLPRLEETLLFLGTFLGQPLSPEHHSWDRLARFFRLLLDTFGLIIATSGDLSQLTLGELSHLGKPALLGGVLRSPDEGLADWLCSALFQVWTHLGSTSNLSRDMMYIVPKSKQACDFLIGDTLVECKRLHATQPVSSSQGLVSTLTRKAVLKASKAADQFSSTAAFLPVGTYPRLLILDVSAYGDWTTTSNGDVDSTGLDEQTHIAPLLAALATRVPEAADGIIVCWTELYAAQGIPFALSYRTKPVGLPGHAVSSAPYTGWTLVYAPMEASGPEYHELRLSSEALSLPYLHATWHSLRNDFYTVGPVEYAPRIPGTPHSIHSHVQNRP